VVGLVFTAVALAARKQMPRLFTGDDAVVKETAQLGCLLAATIFLNSIQPVLSGVLIKPWIRFHIFASEE
jgi:multidrug resistance protein, MATE family